MVDKKNKDKTSEVMNSQKLDVPINEFYTLIINEYNSERDRKQSVESRSGIILSVSMAFFALVLDKVKVSEILSNFDTPLTFNLLLKMSTGLIIYIAYFLSVVFSILTLKSKIYAFYNVSNITTARLMSDRISTFGQLILDYVEIIKTNRNVNDKKIKHFNCAVLCLVICVVCLCIYMNFETGGI